VTAQIHWLVAVWAASENRPAASATTPTAARIRDPRPRSARTSIGPPRAVPTTSAGTKSLVYRWAM